jgi:hypothetical protein
VLRGRAVDVAAPAAAGDAEEASVEGVVDEVVDATDDPRACSRR